jgi:pterin-4a-carbinolamine dehydratase
VFPAKFDRSLFCKPRRTHDYSQSFQFKSKVSNVDIQQMHDLEWARYMCEVVYCLWLHVFSGVI